MASVQLTFRRSTCPTCRWHRLRSPGVLLFVHPSAGHAVHSSLRAGEAARLHVTGAHTHGAQESSDASLHAHSMLDNRRFDAVSRVYLRRGRLAGGCDTLICREESNLAAAALRPLAFVYAVRAARVLRGAEPVTAC